MKVLVATHETQGRRESDFSFCIEGELLRIPFPSDADRGNIDGECGCLRSFNGCDTHRGTTTAKVEERDIDADEFHALIVTSLFNAGWQRPEKQTRTIASTMSGLAASFAVGDVIERRDDEFKLRN